MNLSANSTFIVLRNNKEFGPFTITELKAFGPMASDLLWVEGQSVYWEPMTQLPELKSWQLDTAGAAAGVSPRVIEPKTYYEPELPKIKTPPKKEPEIIITRRGPQFSNNILYTVLVLAGIALGIFLARNGSKRSDFPIAAPPVTAKDSQVTSQPVTEPYQEAGENTTDTLISSPAPAVTMVKPEKNKVISPSKDTELSTDPGKEQLPVEKPANEEKKITTDVKETRNTEIPDLSGSVTLKSSDYVVGSFGGIKDLRLTIRNDSRYTLEKVAVELNYYKVTDELIRTENLLFSQIPPGSSQTIAVKRSSRGVKVSSRIIHIEPRY